MPGNSAPADREEAVAMREKERGLGGLRLQIKFNCVQGWTAIGVEEPEDHFWSHLYARRSLGQTNGGVLLFSRSS